MPSSTPKQAKVMSAISHGWHPTQGDVAKIPIGVAREFHSADAGSKYGAKHKKSRSYAGYGGGVTTALPGQSRAFDPDHPQMDPHRGLLRTTERPSYPGGKGIRSAEPYSHHYYEPMSHREEHEHGAPGHGHFQGTMGGHQIGAGHHSKYHGHAVEPHRFRGARGRSGA